MLALIDPPAVLEAGIAADAASNEAVAVPPALPSGKAQSGGADCVSKDLITLKAGAALFSAGDTRNGYFRVESGALRHTIRHGDGSHALVEFVFPGDIAGLGFLERHVTSAEAVFETRVSPVSSSELDGLLAADESLDGRLAAAIDLEFAVLRERAVAASAGKPMERLAAYLLAVSSINATETGNPALFPGRLTCGYVAQVLGFDVTTLADGLKKLESRGIVKAGAEGLELRNMTALNMLADGL